MAINAPGQDHTVAIIDEGLSSKITPTDTLAAQGDTVTFYNFTKSAVTIMLPDNTVFGGTNFNIESQESRTMPVDKKAPLGAYAYTAYCDATKDFAHASIPRIIIFKNVA